MAQTRGKVIWPNPKQRRIRKSLTRHHLWPKSRFGESNRKHPELMLTWDKHQKWHALWGNKSIEEVLFLLIRMLELKGIQCIPDHFRTEYDHFRDRFNRVE